MDFIKIIELSATILILLSVYLISIPKLLGQKIMIIGQLLWIIFAFLTKSYFFLIQSIILLFFNILAIINWKKKGID